eukprot:CFRG0130T1
MDTEPQNLSLYSLRYVSDWVGSQSSTPENTWAGDVDRLLKWLKERLSATTFGLRHPLESLGYGHHAALARRVNELSRDWLLCMDSGGKYIAVLRDNKLEIRSAVDTFTSFRVQQLVIPEDNPRWRCMRWSANRKLLAIATGGRVHVVTDLGKTWYTIDLWSTTGGHELLGTPSSAQTLSSSMMSEDVNTSTTPADTRTRARTHVDLSTTISALCFAELNTFIRTPSLTEGAKPAAVLDTLSTSTYLYVLFYDSTLYCYEISPPASGGSYTLKHISDLSDKFSLTTTLTMDSAHACIVVGGYPASNAHPFLAYYRLTPNQTPYLHPTNIIKGMCNSDDMSSINNHKRFETTNKHLFPDTGTIISRLASVAVAPVLWPRRSIRYPFVVETSLNHTSTHLLILDATGALMVVAFPSFALTCYVSRHTIGRYLEREHRSALNRSTTGSSLPHQENLNQIQHARLDGDTSDNMNKDEGGVDDDYIVSARWWDTDAVTLTSLHGLVFVISVAVVCPPSETTPTSSQPGDSLRMRAKSGHNGEANVEKTEIMAVTYTSHELKQCEDDKHLHRIRNILYGGVLRFQPSVQIAASAGSQRQFVFLECEEKSLAVTQHHLKEKDITPQRTTDPQEIMLDEDDDEDENGGKSPLPTSKSANIELKDDIDATATQRRIETPDGASQPQLLLADSKGVILFCVVCLMLIVGVSTLSYTYVYGERDYADLAIISATATLIGYILLSVYTSVFWGQSLTDAIRRGVPCESSLSNAMLKVQRMYRRLGVVSHVTPDELLAARVQGKQFDAALTLASVYGLNTDVVYQQQWMDSCGVDPLAMSRYLDNISDIEWVLNECATVVLETVDRCRDLLHYGFGLTHDANTMDAQTNINSYDDADDLEEDSEYPSRAPRNREKGVSPDDGIIKMWMFRTRMLQYMDRLQTYEEILRRTRAPFDPEEFMDFRDCDMVEAAVHFAQAQRFEALHVVLTYHHQATLPHWLSILSQIPENVHPSDYDPLLPKCETDKTGATFVREWLVQDWRVPDWVEEMPYSMYTNASTEPRRTPSPDAHATTPMRSRIKPSQNVDQDVQEPETPVHTQFDHNQGHVEVISQRLNPSQLSFWYITRIIEIDTLSGQVDIALALARVGIRDGVPGLEGIEAISATLNLLVFESQSVYNGLHLDEYTALSGVSRFAYLFEGCDTNDAFINRFSKHGMGFLSSLSKVSLDTANTSLAHLASGSMRSNVANTTLRFGMWTDESAGHHRQCDNTKRLARRTSFVETNVSDMHTEQFCESDKNIFRYDSNPVRALHKPKNVTSSDIAVGLLRDYLCQLARDQYLARCRLVLTESDSLFGGLTSSASKSGPVPLRVSSSDLLAIAVECVYACEDTKQLAEQRRIATWMKQTVAAVQKSLSYRQASMQVQLEVADDLDEEDIILGDVLHTAQFTIQYIEASHLLWQYNIHKTVKEIKEGGTDHAEDLIKRMCRETLDQRPAPTTNEWHELLQMMLELEKGVLNGQVTIEFVLIAYLAAILNSNDKNIIALGRKVILDDDSDDKNGNATHRSPRTAISSLTKHVTSTQSAGKSHEREMRLTRAQAEPVVVKAAREYYNLATSVNDPALELSGACLKLLPRPIITPQRGLSSESHENVDDVSTSLSAIADEMRLHAVCARVRGLPRTVVDVVVPVHFRMFDDGKSLFDHFLNLWFPVPKSRSYEGSQTFKRTTDAHMLAHYRKMKQNRAEHYRADQSSSGKSYSSGTGMEIIRDDVDDIAVGPIAIGKEIDGSDVVRTAATRMTRADVLQLLSLAQSLGLYNPDNESDPRRGSVLSMIAMQAIHTEAYVTAAFICEKIITSPVTLRTGWEACLALGECNKYLDRSDRRLFLGVAMQNCDRNVLERVIMSLHAFDWEEASACVGHTTGRHTANELVDRALEGARVVCQADAVKDNNMITWQSVKGESVWSRNTDVKHDGMFMSYVRLDTKLRTGTGFPLRGVAPLVETDRSTIKKSTLSSVAFLRLCMLHVGGYDKRTSQLPSLENPDMLSLAIAQSTIRNDPLLFVSSLFAVSKPTVVDSFLETFPRQLVVSELALYYFSVYSMLADTTISVNPLWKKESFADTIRRAQDTLRGESMYNTVVSKWKAKISDLRLGAEIATYTNTLDVMRFNEDKEYQGLILDELVQKPRADTFEAAIQLSRRHGLSVWDIALKHLKAILMQPLEDNVRKARFKDVKGYLVSEPVRLRECIISEVMPLLVGTDLSGFLCCFELADLCNATSRPPVANIPASAPNVEQRRTQSPPLSSSDMVRYDTDIRSLKRLQATGFSGLDYRQLRAGGETTLRAMLEVATYANIKTLAQVVSGITTAAYKDNTLTGGSRVTIKQAYERFYSQRLRHIWCAYQSNRASKTASTSITMATSTSTSPRKSCTSNLSSKTDYQVTDSSRVESTQLEKSFMEFTAHMCSKDVFMVLLTGDVLVQLVRSLLLVNVLSSDFASPVGVRERLMENMTESRTRRLQLEMRVQIEKCITASSEEFKSTRPAMTTLRETDLQKKRRERQSLEDQRVLCSIDHVCRHVRSIAGDAVYQSLLLVGRPCYTSELDKSFDRPSHVVTVLSRMVNDTSVEWATIYDVVMAIRKVSAGQSSERKISFANDVFPLAVQAALDDCMIADTYPPDHKDHVRIKLEPVLRNVDNYTHMTTPPTEEAIACHDSVKKLLVSAVSDHKYIISNRLLLLSLLADRGYYGSDEDSRLLTLYFKIDSLCRKVGLLLEDIEGEHQNSTGSGVVDNVLKRQALVKAILSHNGVTHKSAQLIAVAEIVVLMSVIDDLTKYNMDAQAETVPDIGNIGEDESHFAFAWRTILRSHAELVADQNDLLRYRKQLTNVATPTLFGVGLADDMDVLSTLVHTGHETTAVTYACIAAIHHQRSGISGTLDLPSPIHLVEYVLPLMLKQSVADAVDCASHEDVISVLLLTFDNPYVSPRFTTTNMLQNLGENFTPQRSCISPVPTPPLVRLVHTAYYLQVIRTMHERGYIWGGDVLTRPHDVLVRLTCALLCEGNMCEAMGLVATSFYGFPHSLVNLNVGVKLLSRFLDIAAIDPRHIDDVNDTNAGTNSSCEVIPGVSAYSCTLRELCTAASESDQFAALHSALYT